MPEIINLDELFAKLQQSQQSQINTAVEKAMLLMNSKMEAQRKGGENRAKRRRIAQKRGND